MTSKRANFGLALAGFCLTALASSITQAQSESPSNSLEEVVVIGELTHFSATKFNTPIVETARSISIETAAQFINKGALNLSQTTSYMSGVTAETYGFSTRGDWIRSRGLEIPRYRDSIQELFGSYNAARADVYTLEQVELLKGPASVLYGQGSPGGLINAVSKTPKATPHHEIVTEAGTFDRRQLSFDSTGPIADSESWRYRVVGVYRDTGTQVDNVDEKTQLLMPSISYSPSDNTEFTIIGLFQDTESDTGAQFIPLDGTLVPLADGSYLDQDVYAGEPGFNLYDTKSNQVTLLAQHRINDNLNFKATALWRDGEADYHQAWATFMGDGNSRYLNNIIGAAIATSTTVPRSFYQADNTSEQYAADIRLEATFNTGEVEHEILLGVQYQNVSTDNNNAYYYGGGALTGDFSYALDLANPVYTGFPDQSIFDAIYTDNPEQKVSDIGWYISDQIAIDNWRITIGARLDEVDNDNGSSKQSDDSISLSAGLLYHFDNGLSPYISYAESFETVVGTTTSGAQFDPEEGRQYEAGLKWEPEALPGIITLSYFDIEISNLPNPNGLPGTASQQQGITEITGLELEGNIALGEFNLQFAAAVLDGEDPNGFELTASPENSASFWLGWQPADYWQGFRAGVGVRHVGKSVAESSALRYVTDSYTLGDAMVGFQLNQHWDLALNVRNISDEKYLTSCLTRGDCFPGVRRTVNASVRYNF